MDNLAYKERGEDENDEPPSLLQIIDEGFSFEHLKVVEYTTNEEDYQEVLSQGYGENNLIGILATKCMKKTNVTYSIWTLC